MVGIANALSWKVVQRLSAAFALTPPAQHIFDALHDCLHRLVCAVTLA